MKKVSRRSFLQNIGMGAGATALTVSLPSFIDLPGKNHDGKKLNIALCGLGRYAGYLAEGLETASWCRLAGIITGTPARQLNGKRNIIFLIRISTTIKILIR